MPPRHPQINLLIAKLKQSIFHHQMRNEWQSNSLFYFYDFPSYSLPSFYLFSHFYELNHYHFHKGKSSYYLYGLTFITKRITYTLVHISIIFPQLKFLILHINNYTSLFSKKKITDPSPWDRHDKVLGLFSFLKDYRIVYLSVLVSSVLMRMSHVAEKWFQTISIYPSFPWINEIFVLWKAEYL